MKPPAVSRPNPPLPIVPKGKPRKTDVSLYTQCTSSYDTFPRNLRVRNDPKLTDKNDKNFFNFAPL